MYVKQKEILAAGIIRDIQFSSKDLYLYNLDHRKVVYKVLDTFVREDGSMIVRILQQYNNVDLIQLY